MATQETTRRDLLQSLGALSVATLLRPPAEAMAQTATGTPGKVDTRGLTAKIKYDQYDTCGKPAEGGGEATGQGVKLAF